MIVLANDIVVAFLQDKLVRLRTWTLRLYVNAVDPAPDSDASDFTEASFPGYAPLTLTTWEDATLASPGLAETEADNAVFAPTGTGSPQTVFGWFMTDEDGNFVAGERFSDPGGVLLDGPPDAFVVSPRFQDQAIA